MITQHRIKELLNYDTETGIFTWRVRNGNRTKAGGTAGGVNSHGYVQIRLDGVLYKAHRLAWLYMYGVMPEDMIDHINRKTGDNRICNLRVATNSQNQQNAGVRSDSSSGIRGVSWDNKRGKWCARIKAEEDSRHLGYFDNIEEAIEVRRSAESKYFVRNIEEAK